MFRGRPLTDDQTAESLDLGSDDFIIIMQTKKQVVINVPADAESDARAGAPVEPAAPGSVSAAARARPERCVRSAGLP
jgi:hypothetical protein